MKILQVSSARSFGGGERHLLDLARGLAARGHEVCAALPRASPLREELQRALPSENILTLPLRHSLDALSAMRLARFVRERGVSVVHAHVARDYAVAALAARLASGGVRLVVTRHVLFPLGRWHRLTLQRAARVIAVSEAVAHALRARRIVPDEKIKVVHNGINFARFDEAAREFSDRQARENFRQTLGVRAPLLVGTVGELSAVKGQEDFVRASKLIAGAFGDEVEFLVVGADASRDGRTRARLEKLIDELDLHNRVHLTGRRDDVPRVLAALDVFVSASRSEAFGLAIAEAMACGTCVVVATATEGAQEIIRDGETGRLVPVGDAEKIAAAAIILLRNPSERARLCANARSDARARFGLARVVEETEQVYREALQAT